MSTPKGDRLKRLREALPQVSDAVNSHKVFTDDAPRIWNNLRRGLNDVRKEPELLDSLDDERTVDLVWEFMLSLMVASPKFARQIMDAVAVLAASPPWAASFARAPQKGRLALWKLAKGPGNTVCPVDLTLQLIRLAGVSVDELLPADEVVSNAPDFTEELLSQACALSAEERTRFEDSQLYRRWREVAGSTTDARTPSSEPSQQMSQEDLGFGSLTDANRAQVESIEAAGRSGNDGRPGCRQEVVENLLDVTAEALDCAAKCLEPMMSGYTGEQNLAVNAKSKVLELRRRLSDLHARFAVLGPCQAGKTSLTHALVGFAALPPAIPSMVTTEWVHVPSLAVPRLSMPEALAELLQSWAERLHAVNSVEARLAAAAAAGADAESSAGAAAASDAPEAGDSTPTGGRSPGFRPPARRPAPPTLSAQQPLGHTVEGLDAVADALERIHGTVLRGRRTGLIPQPEMEKLSRPLMSLKVEVAFSHLGDLETDLTDTGQLSLIDLPSPDNELWDRQDITNLMKRCLSEADGALVVVDASRFEAPLWLADLLRDSTVQERVLRKEDAWIVANHIDQIPEFFCQDGMADVCSRVREQQHKNYLGVIVGEDHVIPTAARLSLLAIYGLQQVTTQLSPHLLSKLDHKPWFAQVCSFLFGFHWAGKVRHMERSKWRQAMRELQLLGHVTGPLANSVLKTAYVKMLPRSVARVMFDLVQLIDQFTTTMNGLEGGAGSAGIDVEKFEVVFQTYFGDVGKKAIAALVPYVPSTKDVQETASQRTRDGEKVWDGPDAATQNEYFFKNLASEMIQMWLGQFQEGMKKSVEEVEGAHSKWQRSIDHYLMQDKVNAETRRKVLLDSKNLHLDYTRGVDLFSPLRDADRDRLVAKHAAKVDCHTSKKLFQKARRTYIVAPADVYGFLEELRKEWVKACDDEVQKRCLEPIKRNFDEMMQNIKNLNNHLNHFRRRSREQERFDFAFWHQLREVLPKVTSFAADNEDATAIEQDEADRCSVFCDEVRARLKDIESRPGSGR